ncbi:hypothetical protein BDP27DRAFT_1488723 [Rhodocollybia butyracea]|uniref:Uncharacterized protein n=1 Tax=Rhodocollybia butyracea TaxID=206335 RepID=A0A9P5PDE6_9AGAR|nr:hypothetical protein BDP27DRAFT_1488723 [Rhodocollybia butyracea]
MVEDWKTKYVGDVLTNLLAEREKYGWRGSKDRDESVNDHALTKLGYTVPTPTGINLGPSTNDHQLAQQTSHSFAKSTQKEKDEEKDTEKGEAEGEKSGEADPPSMRSEMAIFERFGMLPAPVGETLDAFRARESHNIAKLAVALNDINEQLASGRRQ